MARVLMVNDESDLLELCEMILLGRGHDIRRAESEPEAVRAAVEQRPDVLLLDLVVPGTSGERVLESIRSRLGPRIPVVVMSASEDGPDRARRMGADAFLAKPFAEGELVRIIDGVLGHEREMGTSAR